MAKVEANISMSLDGFVTGPNLNRYPGLGEGGEILHAWTDESRSMDLAMGEERQIAGSVITSRKVCMTRPEAGTRRTGSIGCRCSWSPTVRTRWS